MNSYVNIIQCDLCGCDLIRDGIVETDFCHFTDNTNAKTFFLCNHCASMNSVVEVCANIPAETDYIADFSTNGFVNKIIHDEAPVVIDADFTEAVETGEDSAEDDVAQKTSALVEQALELMTENQTLLKEIISKMKQSRQ